MKTTVEFLHHLKSLDIKIWIKDNQLHLSAPEGALTKVLRAELAERKAEILSFLQNANAVELPNIRPILPVSRDRDLPLSFNQQRLWLVEQIESDSSAYNMPAAFRLVGSLEVAALEYSLNEIVKRHEILRTVFSNVDGQPFQIICSDASLKLPVVDLKKLPKKQQEDEVQQLLIEEAQLLFDLDRWPLLRCKLLRIDEEEHLLLLTAHHIVFDGWSFNIFCQELATLYEAFTTKKSLPFPELPIQYVDFAIWQREWLKDDVLEAQMLYWKQQLEGSVPLLQLPTDLRSSIKTHRGESQSLLLSKDLTEALKTLSRKEGATLFMTLLAAFKTLLLRYTGQEDILVGSPIAGRNRKELERLIGFFVNTLVLRTSVSSNVSFRELLSRVREVTLGAYVHQDIPLEKLLEELKLKRDLNHNPLFRVWFNMANVVDTSLELSGLSVETISNIETPAKFDLNLYVREQKQAIELKLVYNIDLFEAERMIVMLNQFEYLLKQIVSTPEKTIQSYSLLTLQSQPLLPDPRVVLPEPVHEPITNLFISWANRTPKQIAISQGDRSWTYDELVENARAITQVLITHGIKRGDVVAVSGSKSFGLIASMLGVLLSGGVLLTLAQNFPKQRQQLMLEQAQAQHLLHVGQLPKDKEWIKEFIEISFIDPETGNPGIPDSLPFNSYIPEPPNSDDAAYVFFTSGTTGTPKGILGSHKGLSHFLNWQRQQFAVSPQDRLAQLTGLSFDVVLRDIFLPLTSGATLCLPEVEDDLTPAYILPWLERVQISLLHTVPTLAQSWLTDMSPAISLRKLRWVFFAGEPLTKMLVCRWRRAFPEAGKIVNLYGPTETTLAKCFYEIPDNVLPGVQPIGFSLPESQALVLAKDGQMCGISELGEIVLRTPFRSNGYINASEENQRRFVQNYFGNDEKDLLYYTGDRGRYRPDGSLEILGRIDHQVKINGIRIELEEIEAFLSLHPRVQQAVVTSTEDTIGKKRLVAYVVSENDSLSSSQLREFLQRQLPNYMMPSALVILNILPLTPNGKIDRKALPASDISSGKLDTKFVAPRTPTEKLLANIWTEILGIKRVGVHDNFFELGGDSILAIQVVGRANQTKISLTLKKLFHHQTIAELATVAESMQIIEAQQNTVTGSVPLMPFQRNLLAIDFSQPHILYLQSFFLEALQPLNLFLFERAIRQLFIHHDALRLRFIQTESGWQQINLEVEDNVICCRIDLSVLSDVEQDRAIKAAVTEFQYSLNLSKGPLLRAAIFELGAGKSSKILIVIHHLVVDRVSTSILMEDLQTAYQQLNCDKAILLPPKTTSFKSWAQRIVKYAKSETIKEERDYWLGILQKYDYRLPLDYPDKEENTHFNKQNRPVLASVRQNRPVLTSLSVEETQVLLKKVTATYCTRFIDVLLTALVQTFARWTGKHYLLVRLLSHGRDSIFEDIDLSRTVGWLNLTFPVLLSTSKKPNSAENVLKTVKKQLDQIPNSGIGYSVLRYLSDDVEFIEKTSSLPYPEVVFNYYGQYNYISPDSPLFTSAQEPKISEIGHIPKRMTTEIRVAGFFVNRQLQLRWQYGESFYLRSTIKNLAQDYLEALRYFIAQIDIIR
jgi:amino acid adenylation domain-containing protein/non-ribosomal peptide synthase protein (TIGR01720 family)